MLWQVYLFGCVRIAFGERTISHFPTEKTKHLLAYLAYNLGARKTREALSELLWPSDSEDAPANARQCLNNTLYHLRNAFAKCAGVNEPSPIISDREAVCLNPELVDTDIRTFEQLLKEAQAQADPFLKAELIEKAVRLRTDKPLCNIYGDWVDSAAESIDTMFHQALDELISIYKALNRETDVIQCARRALQIDPTAESFARELMLAYCRIGKPSAAQQVYRELVRALGHPPLPETQELADEVRAGLGRSNKPAKPKSAQEIQIEPSTAGLYTKPDLKIQAIPVTALVARTAHGDVYRTNMSIEAFEKVIKSLSGRQIEASDGVFRALFAAPDAGERYAERAVRAALQIQQKAKAAGVHLSVGLCSGRAHGHNLLTAGKTVLQDADLLSKAAESGEVLACELTRRLAEGAFGFSERKPERQPQDDQSRKVYSVVGLLPNSCEYSWPHGLQTPFVGRRDETAQLMTVFARAVRGRAQAAFITGEQTVGKSRLVMEFRRRLTKTKSGRRGFPHLWLEGRCRDLHIQTPFFPFADLLRRWAAQQNSTGELSAVTTWLYRNGVLTGERAKELLEELGPSLFAEHSEAVSRPWTSEQVLYQVRTAIKDILLAAARLGPVVVALEDIHWADDHTLDFVLELAVVAEHLPLLLLCTLRQEHAGRSVELPEVVAHRCPGRCTKIELRELSPEETLDLLEALLKREELDHSFKREIVDKSGGNPFFLQELVRHLIETGRIVRENGRWTCSGAGKLDVPERVKSIILSRVSRLAPPLALVLGAGAVLGISFEQRVLQLMLGLEDSELEKALARLQKKRFLLEENAFPNRKFCFYHALVQQAVYENISEGSRIELHRMAAQALEAANRENPDAVCQELAHHYIRAGCPNKAIPHLIKMGHNARMLCSHSAAVEYFTLALKAADDTADDETSLRLKMEALIGLAKTHQGVGDLAAAEQCFRDALAVAEDLGVGPKERVRILYWLADILFWQSRFHEMELVARTGLGLLPEEDSPSMEAVIMNSMIGIARQNLGDESEWMWRARRSAELLPQMPYTDEIRRVYAHVIESLAYSEAKPDEAEEWCALYSDSAKKARDSRGTYDAAFRRGQMLFHSGRVAESIQAFQTAADGFEQIGDPKYLCWCLTNLAEAHLQLGLLEKAEEYALRSIQCSQKTVMRRDAGRCLFCLGAIHTAQRKYEQAASDYRQAFAVFKPQPHEYNMALAMTRLALACMHAGRLESAKEYALRALKLGELFQPPFALTLAVLEELGVNISSMFSSLLERHKEMRGWHFKQWKLESAAPEPFWPQILHHTFSQDIPSGFHWCDQTSESEYRINRGLEIRVANGCDLWHINLTAPRLCTEVEGNFAVQTEIGPHPHRRPSIGGLVIWADRHNFLRLDKGGHGPHEIRFSGAVNGIGRIFGRGRIESESTILRLERKGSSVRALCSTDRKKWFTVGQTSFTAGDPVEVGIFASGYIDRSIYPSAHRRGTAIRFRRLWLWAERPEHREETELILS